MTSALLAFVILQREEYHAREIDAFFGSGPGGRVLVFPAPKRIEYWKLAQFANVMRTLAGAWPIPARAVRLLRWQGALARRAWKRHGDGWAVRRDDLPLDLFVAWRKASKFLDEVGGALVGALPPSGSQEQSN